jgi:general secretion pathway protein A
MYEHYFGLAEVPFSIAPDPRYLYMSERHREALAHLIYGISRDGCFVLLTGEVGTGKTTICRCLLEQIPEDCDIAIILNPRLTVEELLETICKEFGIPCSRYSNSVNAYVDRLNEYLIKANARGRKAVLIIDEAQNLSVPVLEQMRLLTNLETNQRKLLQIILLGQPELREMIARPNLRQLAQRITARYHLAPLTKHEIAAYVTHRLAVSGVHSRIFPSATIAMLSRLSGGIPRLINVLCDRALLGAYIEGESAVSKRVLGKAAREVLGDSYPARVSGAALRLAMMALLAALFTVATVYYDHPSWLIPNFALSLLAPAQAVAQPAR